MASMEEEIENIRENELQEIASMGEEMENIREVCGDVMTLLKENSFLQQVIYSDVVTDLNREHKLKEATLNIKVASLEKEIAGLKQEMTSLLRENQRCRDNLADQDWRHADKDTSMALLIDQISEMRDNFDQEKKFALENCKETLEKEFNDKHDKLRKQLISARVEIDHTKFLHAQTCEKMSARERELKLTFSSLLQEKLSAMIDKVEQDVRERENSMREKMKKELEEFMDFLLQSIESKIKEDSPENMEIMTTQMKEHEFKTSVWQRIESDVKEAFKKTEEVMLIYFFGLHADDFISLRGAVNISP